MAHINGEMVSYGDGGLRLFFYATELFGDFTLRMQFRIFDAVHHNSGVFLRFPRPSLDLSPALQARTASEPFFDAANPAWKPVVSGFEVQIDDTAQPHGLIQHRTGAIYNIDPAAQTYNPGSALVPGVWFEYEIVTQGDDYTVFLTDLQSGQRTQTTHFINTDPDRGRSPGCIGIQVYPGSVVAWRHIRVKT